MLIPGHAQGLILGSGEGGVSFTSIWDRNLANEALTTGWDNYTIRNVFPNAVLSGDTGTTGRVTFRGATGSGSQFTNVYIGILSGTYGFAATPVPILFGGSSTLTLGVSAEQVSDEFSLTVGASDALVISFYDPTGGANGHASTNQTPAGSCYWKLGNDASNTSPTGYSILSASRFALGIRKIEIG